MDGHRFDEFARLMSGGRSRRATLKFLGGGVVGAVTAVFGRRVQDARAGEVCSGFLECCGDNCEIRSLPGSRDVSAQAVAVCCDGLFCVEGACSDCIPNGLTCELDTDCCGASVCGEGNTCQLGGECRTEGNKCASSDDCCDDLICDDAFTCQPVPICAELDGECVIDDDCCDDLVCTDATCQPPVTCAGADAACDVDDDCCTGICCAGFCRDIECCIDEEDPNARCPEGTACFEGSCDELPCITEGETCGSDDDCCDGLVCSGSVCKVLSASCIEEGDACETGDDCCSDLICIDAICGTPRLPDTGSGASDGAGSWIPGAALAAGSVALVAAKRSRDARSKELPD